jgi:hypothetical protein
MIAQLQKTSSDVHLQQIPGILQQLKGAIEIFYAMELQDFSHPIARLERNYDLEGLYVDLLEIEKDQAAWLIEKYATEDLVPQQFLPAWKAAKGIKG